MCLLEPFVCVAKTFMRKAFVSPHVGSAETSSFLEKSLRREISHVPAHSLVGKKIASIFFFRYFETIVPIWPHHTTPIQQTQRADPQHHLHLGGILNRPFAR
jgi:hypothetical protein